MLHRHHFKFKSLLRTFWRSFQTCTSQTFLVRGAASVGTRRARPKMRFSRTEPRFQCASPVFAKLSVPYETQKRGWRHRTRLAVSFQVLPVPYSIARSETQSFGLVFSLLVSYQHYLRVSFICLVFGCAYRFGLPLIESGYTTPFAVFRLFVMSCLLPSSNLLLAHFCGLNAESMSFVAFGLYFPESVLAQFSAGVVFRMLRRGPKTDSV